MKMAAKLMHAVQYDGYGGGAAAFKHVEVTVPTPKQNEVLLKVEATSLNPIDWKIQKGMLRPLLPCKFPYIPATDVAGEVVDVGPGVKNFKAGDKVVTTLGQQMKLPVLQKAPPRLIWVALGGGLPPRGAQRLQQHWKLQSHILLKI
ncbi:hypothetical protein SLEP1_g42448 [Rubroshorea leprosula]|uniref:Alcohol dehydrogenase-like N-terminal domain-containing protein n=1 Tax=Rubroshorea leprosula TaxID=152421 RepID=A0AAV5LA89_9ROSI|nr:hypothetical protein SLEP1_g42448 [Rubroshorea leprosula]